MTDEYSSIREELATYRDAIRSLLSKNPTLNEAEVCHKCIDPLLRILGWTLGDISREHSVEGGERVDYALSIDGKVKLLLDAKKAKEKLDKHRKQVLFYCIGEDIRFGVLFNGESLELLDSRARGDSRRLFSCSLEEGVAQFDSRLRYLVRAEVAKGSLEGFRHDESERKKCAVEEKKIREKNLAQLKTEYEKLQISLPGWFILNLQERLPEVPQALIGEFVGRQLGVPARSQTQVDVKTAPMASGNRFRSMKIGSEMYQIRHSYDILLHTVEWLIHKGELRREHCPIPYGPTRDLVNTVPKHRTGGDFRAPKKLSNGLYMDANHSTAGCINGAKSLLEKFGYSQDLLEFLE
ncbi:MAG: hypothetical protein HY558_06020 [Euryarchaeota archaeon]|nr:hypothetical protein [Euryarchaeota archaeon]